MSSFKAYSNNFNLLHVLAITTFFIINECFNVITVATFATTLKYIKKKNNALTFKPSYRNLISSKDMVDVNAYKTMCI